MSDIATVTGSASRIERGATNPKTAALLFDTRCTLRVVLGRAWVPLGKLRKLTKGSVIELDGSIQKPVEVFVKGCLVARGEVVVVNGNYGIRITAVASHTERIQASQIESA
jgi:flagellar motor switch protein FliN/FliY